MSCALLFNVQGVPSDHLFFDIPLGMFCSLGPLFTLKEWEFGAETPAFSTVFRRERDGGVRFSIRPLLP